MAAMIETRGLAKRFGPIRAVDDVSLSVARGEVLGFLGPNGAGKSTTMKMITGFLPPTAGTASICGFDVQDRPIEAKRRLGYLPEGAPLYGDMTPKGFLAFIAAARGLSGLDRRQRIDEAVRRTNLEDVMNQPIDTLSKGFKRRVGLAQALLHDPEVLILDEPTDGLDPNQKHEVRALIRAMAPEKAIVISTHILEEVEAVCTRAVIIAAGRIVADGTPRELAARSRFNNAVTVTVPGEIVAVVQPALESLKSVDHVEGQPGRDGTMLLTAFPKRGAMILPNVSQLVQAHGWAVRDIRSESGNLDDVFRTITKGRGEPGGPPILIAPEPTVEERAHA